MTQALYRKYRSRTFGELVGQEHVTGTLERAVKEGKISHAYLFTGPRGIGKTSIARILAYAINQLEYSDKPHLDIIEIDAASNRRIEDVRDLREKVQIAPVSAKYKVYIIDEVHMLTNESFNALLKTLEEPPEHVVFILATTELHKLPATITSRTQRFAFVPPSTEMIAAHLTKLAEKENINITPEAIMLLAEHADGSFRDSISLLDQISTSQADGELITEETIANMLGLPPKTTTEALLQAIDSRQPAKVAEQLSELKANGISAATIASALIRHIAVQAHTNISLTQLLSELLSVPRHTYPEVKLLAVLLEAAHGSSATNAPPPKPKSAPLTASQSAPAITAAPVEKPKKKHDPAPELKPETKATKSVTPTKTIDGPVAEHWGDVLAALQTQSAPLRGTLKKADVRTAENGTIILAFKYALHSKKIDDSKHKMAIANAIKQVLGLENVIIETAVDPNATPTPPKVTESGAAVIEVMGGGEMVHYN